MENVTPRNNQPDPNISLKKLIKYDEIYLQKEDTIYKIIIGKFEQNILLECKKYVLFLNNDDLSSLLHIELYSLEDCFQFLINSFDKKAIILEDINRERIKLKLKIKYNNNEKKEAELILSYRNNYKDLFINEINNNYYEIEEKIKICKNEIIQLKNEINTLKRNNNNKNSIKNNKNNYYNPKNLQYLHDLPLKSFSAPEYSLNNTFTVFKDMNKILCLVCSKEDKSLISYDLFNNKIIKEIRNAHNKYITNIRHFLDSINKRDLILSLSSDDNYLKVWNHSTFEKLLDIKAYRKGILYSACFLSYNNNIFIISGNVSYFEFEPIKIFSFDLQDKNKKIKNSNDKTFFISTYNENGKTYILTGNALDAKSYDFDLNELYQKYSDQNKNKQNDNVSIVIINNEGIIKLIDSSSDGNIRIWNFHSGDFLKKIFVSKQKLFEICIYNNDYLLVGCEDNKIKIIELKKSEIIHELIGHKDDVITIKSIIHPAYGNCFFSQGLKNDGIKLWIEKK